MTVRGNITRRGLTLAGLSAGFLWAGERLPWVGLNQAEAAARRVLGAISADWRGAQAAGHFYVQKYGLGNTSLDRLLALIALDSAKPAREIRAQVQKRVRRDFSLGEVVTVDGWILSLTEARLYAVATLVERTGRGAF